MRVAVLADIHGNLAALDAVLDDVDAADVDAIVLNGDLATGPMPAETLDRLAELGERAIWVRGNADRELVAAYDGALNPDLPEAARLPTERPGVPSISGPLCQRLAGRLIYSQLIVF
jgi:putative phosphoesterase